MNEKIAVLTQKLYQEGVEKGEARANEIIAEAETESQSIIAEARARANEIIEDANLSAEETRRNVDAELRLSAAQALDHFKQQLQDSVVANMIDDAVAESLADTRTVTDLIRTCVERWADTADRNPDLLALVPESKHEELEASVKCAVSEILHRGIEVRSSDTMRNGFRVGPRNGGFVVSFTDDDFREFFKDFAKPRARKYLFGE